MQARNRGELDQLINMRNQELQQQRNMEAMDYQLGMQDYVRQREGLEADIAQQRANIGAAAGATVADIPQYVQNFRMYNALKNAPKPAPVPETPMATTAMPRQANPLETQMFSRLGFPGFYSPDSYLNNPSSYLDQELYAPYMRQTQSPVFRRR